MSACSRCARRLVLTAAAVGLAVEPPAAAPRDYQSQTSFGALAPAFVANTGQTDAAARFVSIGGGRPIFFTRNDARIVDPGRHRSLWLSFVGGQAAAIDGGSPTGGSVAYLNSDSRPHRPSVAYYDILYRDVWPGIDARVTGVAGGIEYSFELEGGADPGAIRLRYLGVDRMVLNARGELVLDAGGETIVDRAPRAYQRVDGRSTPVVVRFVQRGDDVMFALGDYDRTKPLVIDPTLVYSTYLGGSGYDVGHAIAVDSAGAAYVAGGTQSPDFPTTPGVFQPMAAGERSAFVAKINPAGTRFDYVTYLGAAGGGTAEASGIAVDVGGNAYVAGFGSVPTTSGAYRMTPNGSDSAFLTKLNPTGTDLVYSAAFGGPGLTQAVAVAIDPAGNAYVTGATTSTNLPTTSGSVGGPSSQQLNQAYLLKFDATGSVVTYGTYVGGSDNDTGTSVAVDAAGRAVIVGTTSSLDLNTTARAVQPNSSPAVLESTDGGQTFVGVSGSPHPRFVNDIAIDPQQPTTIYEASYDQGLLESSDGGTTWSRLPVGGVGWSVAINPITPTTVFEVGSRGGPDNPGTSLLNRSTDGGASWTNVLVDAGVFAMAPSNPSTLYATVKADLVKSTDNGNTWSTVAPSSNPTAIAIDPSNPSIVYVGNSAGVVTKTTNGGTSWTANLLPGSSGFPVNAIAVDPTSTSVVWAGSTGGLFETIDGGSNWTEQFVGVHGPSRLVFDGGTLYVADGLNAAPLAKTTDRGAHWSSLTIRGNVVPLRALAALGGMVWVGVPTHLDAFAYRIDTNATTPSAALIYGTYLGGMMDDSAVGVALDPSGNAVVGLQTGSQDLPVTMATSSPSGARQMAVARLSPDGSAYTALTYTSGGSSYTSLSAIAVDRNGYAYTTGIDQDGYFLWVEQVDATGASIVGFTQFSDSLATVNAIATDAAGGVYVTGTAGGSSVPTTANAPQPSYGGAIDAYVEKISFADSTVDLARGATAVASSIEAPQYAAGNAVDGDPTTRWSSQFSDPQWIYVDLGQQVSIDHVVLRWETAYASEYGIQTSDDGQSWQEITHRFSRGGTDSISYPQPKPAARFVRMFGYHRGTEWGYSLWSFEVYGTPLSGPPPPSGGSLPGNWFDRDIGAVGIAGAASFASDTFTVNGAGSDIWGTADSFNFAASWVEGDGQIVARVTTLQNTNPFAKAGIMLRVSNGPSDEHVILDVRPTGDIEFMSRESDGSATTFIAGTTAPAPVWLRLTRAGLQVAAAVSPNGSVWTTLGAITLPSLPSPLLAGLAVTSHNTSTLNTATFDNVVTTFSNSSGLPVPWASQDIAGPGAPIGTRGSASFANNTFTVKGAGADIWGTADAFQYVYQPVSGDVQIVTRVDGEQNTNAFAKAGVTLRQFTTSTSTHVILDVRPDGSLEFMTRSTDGGATMFLAGGSQAFPVWLKLTRTGSTVTGSVSGDGRVWTTVGSTPTDMPTNVNIGLVVTSHDSTVLNTALFDNVALNSLSSPPPPSNGNIVVYASDVPAAGLHGSWMKTSDVSAADGVTLTTPDNGTSQISNPIDDPTDYVDVTFNAAAATPYTIWLRLQSTANSKYNDSVWLQFSNAAAEGSTVYQIGSPDGLLVNLATDSTGSSLNGWGWQNTAYWLSQATTVTFPTAGAQTLRIQIREDGVQLDQIVLSPSQFLSARPGSATNDTTIVPKS